MKGHALSLLQLDENLRVQYHTCTGHAAARLQAERQVPQSKPYREQLRFPEP